MARTGSPVRLNRAAYEAWRDARGLRDSEVADTLGVDRGAFSLVKHGRYGCSARVIAGFRRLYNVRFDFGEDRMYLFDPTLQDPRPDARRRRNH